MNLVIPIIIAIALIAFIIWFRFTDNPLRRNLRAITGIIVIAVCVVILFFLGRHILRTLRDTGEGRLFSDMISTQDASAIPENDTDSDTEDGPVALTIEIHLDEIHIGDAVYSSPEEAFPAIDSLWTPGTGSEVRLIDNYATASTYSSILDHLINVNGINRSDISEEKTE